LDLLNFQRTVFWSSEDSEDLVELGTLMAGGVVIKFGLSQYSDQYVEHFDFLRFKATPNPDDLIKQVSQLNGATHTATYIQKVVREMFLPEKGARSDASKILIVITDGKKTGDPLQYNDVIPEAQMANIIRFAIG
ncbi:integrin alpha-M-like, partial [Pseudonaja textilis]|uniref:integrin alpha-M-like n=1 Tax=Pseudonaja textilis TaxID=8673 RepID=UPI000EA89BC6